MNWKVPLFDLKLGIHERLAIGRVLASNWITIGPFTQRFNSDVARFVGSKHALAVSSGTAALHLAFSALGIGPGDEVLCPSLSFVATANAIVMTGAKPVFVDVESEERLHMSLDDAARKITRRTRVLATVDYGGYPLDTTPIEKTLKRRGIRVVEDAAHAIGASVGHRPCGTLGDIGCFSFYSNKNMTTAEGGMVVTSEDELARRMRLLSSHGMTTLSYERHRGHSFDYDVLAAGYNYRIDDIRAALGLAQLRRLRQGNARRERLVRLYRKELAGLDGVGVPFAKPAGKPSYHIMPILLPEGTNRAAVMTAMAERRVQTSIHYRPIHTFTYYRKSFARRVRLPILDAIAPRLLTLPLYPHMTAGQVRLVVRALADALEKG